MDKNESKNVAQLFQTYDGDVQINPFAKVHWGVIEKESLSGKLYVDNEKNYGIIGDEAKTVTFLFDSRLVTS